MKKPLLTNINRWFIFKRKRLAISICLLLVSIDAFSNPTVYNLSEIEEERVVQDLQPGDILFSYNIINTEWKIRLINYFQKLNIKKQSISDRSFSKYYHVFIYLGEGDFLEASELNKYSIKIFKLKDYLLPTTEEIHVFRYSDDNIAAEAVTVCRKIAQLREGKTDSNYSIWTSIRSVFTSGEFETQARKRYIKAALGAHLMEKYALFPPSKRGEYHFICPALVAYAYQTAEAKAFLRRLKTDIKSRKLGPSRLDYLLGILEDPILDDLNPDEQRLAVDRWAKLITQTFWQDIGCLTNFNLNTKVLSPQKFREYIKSQEDKFQFVMKIISSDKRL